MGATTWVRRGSQYLWIVLLLAFFVTPLLWMVSTSFKTAGEIYTANGPFFPIHWTLRNYHVALATGVGRMFLNSTIVAVSTTVVALLFAVLSSYAVSRLLFRGRKLVLISMILSQLIPLSVLIVPIYQIMAQLNLLDEFPSLVIAYLTFSIPVAVWFLRSFFLSVPAEIEEAARVDGCSTFGAFVRIVIPLIVPGLIATGIYVFVTVWQELMFAITFLTTPSMYTLPAGVILFIGQHGTNFGAVMAAATIMSIPPSILFLLMQKRLISGFASAGGIK